MVEYFVGMSFREYKLLWDKEYYEKLNQVSKK